METLLVHEEIAPYILTGLQEELSAHGTILKGCPKTLGYIKIAPAKEEDFDIEYLENILNIKVVENLKEAIDHISKHGSGHSEAILSEKIGRASCRERVLRLV